MIEIGRVVVKTAGRDSSKKAVIIDVLDDKYVLIDGETRRRKCNVAHLLPLQSTVKIEKSASHEEVANALKELGLSVRETKPKQKTTKPIKKRKSPEQLRAQKDDKKRLRDLFKPKKDAAKKESSLEEKATIKEKKIEGIETTNQVTQKDADAQDKQE